MLLLLTNIEVTMTVLLARLLSWISGASTTLRVKLALFSLFQVPTGSKPSGPNSVIDKWKKLRSPLSKTINPVNPSIFSCWNQAGIKFLTVTLKPCQRHTHRLYVVDETVAMIPSIGTIATDWFEIIRLTAADKTVKTSGVELHCVVCQRCFSLQSNRKKLSFIIWFFSEYFTLPGFWP